MTLTMPLLKAMREEAFERKSVKGVKRMIKAFRCGCHLGQHLLALVPLLRPEIFTLEATFTVASHSVRRDELAPLWSAVSSENASSGFLRGCLSPNDAISTCKRLMKLETVEVCRVFLFLVADARMCLSLDLLPPSVFFTS